MTPDMQEYVVGTWDAEKGYYTLGSVERDEKPNGVIENGILVEAFRRWRHPEIEIRMVPPLDYGQTHQIAAFRGGRVVAELRLTEVVPGEDQARRLPR